MPADRGVDRAMVEAGGAAQAAEHVLELAAEQFGAAVVEQHDMILLGAVEVGRPARPGRDRRIGREFLPRCRARQESQQGRSVFQGRDDLFEAGHDDVDPRQGLRQVAVALIGDDDARAGFGNQEIGPGDADFGGKEVRAQDGARLLAQGAHLLQGAVGVEPGMRRAERVGDLLLHQVDRRRDNVARWLVAQLDDVFAEIGLNGGDAICFEVIVERDLLGDH